MKKEFWKDWKRKTSIEKKAIEAVKRARELIIRAIPKKKLVAIYIKGSFIRREMKRGSDVDIVPIVAENKYEKPIFELNKPEITPCVIVPLSLWELKNNKLFTKNNSPRARPDRFIKYLSHYKLIYGKALNTTNFKIRTDEESFKALIKAFKKSFIPLYEKGKLGFSGIIKETFWLTELEQRIKLIIPIFSFRGVSKSIRDKNHIVHDAWKLRLHKTKDKRKRKAFIIKLKKHLKRLEELN